MTRPYIRAEIRRRVFARAGHLCEYCRSPLRSSLSPFSVEHIIPVIRGGLTTLDNLALSCQGCNNYKYDKIDGFDPVSRERAPLYHPRRQRWGDHFCWSEDFTLLIGLTPTGRATIATLELNREGVVDLRELLIAKERHPPADPALEAD